ncbi:MAG: 16S rRNA (adenine(1518)-N(6)/adenine(1519)-N(6))-dimethyltransferase RsmA [Saprospiraceae bacterium]
MRAKKSYGQHFLTNEVISERIADSLQRTAEYDKVLEVGPGQGMLTKYLLKRDYELLVVEADRDMVAHLQQHYPELRDNIIPADFLKLNLYDFFKKESFSIIGNFPYNISSQIVFKTIEYRAQVPEMVGMFQREMAERVAAKEGSKTYGVISVLTQAFYEVEYLFTVKAGNFNPPPKVQSAVIRLTRKDDDELGCDYKVFRRVVKQAFGQRRKMLRNTLKPIFKNSERITDPIMQQRPEQLSVAEFVQLTQWAEEVLKSF